MFLRFATGVLAIYWIAIFYATHSPVPEIDLLHTSDKVMHLLAYSVLAFQIAMVLHLNGRQGISSVFWTLLITAAYGVFDEVTQPLVNRIMDLGDWVADQVGALIGIVAFRISKSVFQRMEQARSARSP